MRSIAILLMLLTLAIVLTAIAIGPADLYEKDQPKTLAYTADILTHGRWALPRDVLYQLATKPPLYNWIAAAVIWASGSWSETAMKSPSVIGGVGVGVILFVLPIWIARRIGPKLSRRDVFVLGALAASLWFACGIDIRHGSTMRLMYLARPDMLQAFFLTAAWAIATSMFVRFRHRSSRSSESPTDQALTLALSQEERGPEKHRASCEWVGAILFWFCIAGAILTKGPMALLAIAFVPIGAIAIARSWRAIFAFKPLVGFALLFVIVGSWFYFAYRTEPAHVKSVILGAEIVNRVTNQTPEGIEKPFYFAAMWFFTKGGPVCVLAVIATICAVLNSPPLAGVREAKPDPHAGRGGGSRGASALDHSIASDPSPNLSPDYRGEGPEDVCRSAALWLVILLIGLSIPAGKRIDYLLPTFAPAALLAASVLVSLARRLWLSPLLAFGVPIALACFLGYARTHTFHEAKEHWSDRATTFMHDVNAKTHGEPLLVLVRGKHPLTSLLGRHQGSTLTVDDLKAATWIILPTANTTATPVLTSEPLPIGFETIETRPLGTLGLYRANESDSPKLDELVTTMRSIATWSTDENPYHAPDTVWRETSPK